MEIINEKLKILSESDIENILIDNFHRFVIVFSNFTNFDHLAAGYQPVSWVITKFFRITQIRKLKNKYCNCSVQLHLR